jgi:hypothetical protein
VAFRIELRDGQRARQLIAVLYHECAYLIGHLRDQEVPLLAGEIPLRHRGVQQDLDVDLVIGAVHACAVIDRIGVDAATGQGVFDTPALRQPEVAALPHHFAAQIPAIDPDAVVGAIAGLGVRLAGGLDKGPDATVPEEVHRRLEQRADEVRR